MNRSPNTGNFDAMKALSMADLRWLWREQAGRKGRQLEPPRVRSLLVRDLAWWAQQRVHGGLDAEAQSPLKAAIRRSDDHAVDARGDPRTACRNTRKRWNYPQRRNKSKLKTGTKLVRTWRGKTYEVVVCEDGKEFQFRGQVYRSLTPIAKKITGAHWSGPRFFGLNRVRAVR